jgi:pimeloyl-ACP methyl ester carboxylesterase
MKCIRLLFAVMAAMVATSTTNESSAQQLSPAAVQAFNEFVTYAPHRAFYIAEDGSGHSWSGTNGETPERAVINGHNNCLERWKKDCRLYAVNNFLIGAHDWREIVQARSPNAVDIGRLRPQPYWGNNGPATAAGLLVWSHDYEEAIDRTASAPGPFVGYFTRAGYDLYRFDRKWTRDSSADATQFADLLRQARANGYKRIVLAGLGAGAWVSLVAAARGAPVDGVVAIAPEFRGETNALTDASTARSEWRKVTASLPTGPRVFVVNFARNAPTTGDYAADARNAFSASGANAVVVADPPDFPDRAALQRTAFGRTYGGCIFRFIDSGARQAPCS